ncbi:MAG TPA: hypothetical protein VIQ51_05445 [Chryseosolibacter sp.]
MIEGSPFEAVILKRAAEGLVSAMCVSEGSTDAQAANTYLKACSPAFNLPRLPKSLA